MLRFFGAGSEVDVLQRIQLVNHDVNIIASYTGALHGDSLALICTGDGVEFAAGNLAFLSLEVRCYEGYSAWVAYEDYFIRHLLRAQMKVEATSIFIDDEL